MMSAGAKETPVRPSGDLRRTTLGVAVGAMIFWVLNALFASLFGGATFEDELTRNSTVAAFTLLVPGFIAGFAAGKIAPASGLTAGVMAGAIPAVIRMFHRDWQIASNSLGATHSAVYHYFTQNPITLVTFTALGGWLAGQFGVGRFTLNDARPVNPEDE